MSAYKDIEIEFIDRTMQLIDQYEHNKYKYPFDHQYNFTLLINCLLGLIVLPREKSLSFLPTTPRLTKSDKISMGLVYSVIDSKIKNLKDLLVAMRNSVAHFHISVQSLDDENRIDKIIFGSTNDLEKAQDSTVAIINSNELLPFLRYYTGWLKTNILSSRQAKEKRQINAPR